MCLVAVHFDRHLTSRNSSRAAVMCYLGPSLYVAPAEVAKLIALQTGITLLIIRNILERFV
jgi:hypothetical protein